MQPVWFTEEIPVGTYLDPFDEFQEKEVRFAIRRDAITGVTAHILPYRFRVLSKPDLTAYLEQSPVANCPFCLPQREQLTPKFPATVVAGGRFCRGEAVLFPNAFPHDRHNSVAVLSREHFVAMEALSPAMMRDGFRVCIDYLQRLGELDGNLQYGSLNWNYMPPAGGGLLHPHLQTVSGARPTRFVQTLLASADHHERETGNCLWYELATCERAQGERFVAATGQAEWFASFAPQGMAGEIYFLFRQRHSLFALTEDDWEEMLMGLSYLFRYFEASNIASFNLAIYGTYRQEHRFCVQGRVVPRFCIPPLGTSDVNYFEKLHDEIICPIVPEQLCAELKGYFPT